ncbi:hypothetical protein S101446_01936 [Komagataeibacter europaeus]|nr:hypothetical protein [Komagataeibacter europaeus]ARW17053.1 hypothetical protein S101446_01936 [Komagataeibacter europaeus]
MSPFFRALRRAASAASLSVALGSSGAGMAAESGPVLLAQHPGTELDRQARRLVAQDLHDAANQREQPVLLTGSGLLSDNPRRMALFVQLQSASLCGSAGCSTSVYLPDGHKWTLVLDSVSGPITITPQVHDNMHDLLVDETDRWIWNGTTYIDTQAAPEPAPTGQ